VTAKRFKEALRLLGIILLVVIVATAIIEIIRSTLQMSHNFDRTIRVNEKISQFEVLSNCRPPRKKIHHLEGWWIWCDPVQFIMRQTLCGVVPEFPLISACAGMANPRA
jgi:hypothetical protein